MSENKLYFIVYFDKIDGSKVERFIYEKSAQDRYEFLCRHPTEFNDVRIAEEK